MGIYNIECFYYFLATTIQKTNFNSSNKLWTHISTKVIYFPFKVKNSDMSEERKRTHHKFNPPPPSPKEILGPRVQGLNPKV
jgi:hypothetical protein